MADGKAKGGTGRARLQPTAARRSGGRKQPEAAARSRKGTARGQQRKAEKARQTRRNLLRRAVFLLGTGVLALGACLVWLMRDLPDIDHLIATETRPASVVLTAADRQIFDSRGEWHGRSVTVADLPPHVPGAFLAVEDRRFYEHFGLDLAGLGRAVYSNVSAGKLVEGGSTLTQQLARTLFLTPEKSLERKLREALLALALEQRFSKDELLGIYLNRIYFGAGTWGIDAASRRYFSKPATKLDRFEAALLAGLPAAPSAYNPLAGTERSLSRTRRVLRAMQDHGMLTAEEAAHLAEQAPARLAALQDRQPSRASHFTDYVLARLGDSPGLLHQDLAVQTSLIPRLQALGEELLATRLRGPGPGGIKEKQRPDQGALVALDNQGRILAMVGGLDYARSQYNRAVQARRQPGSTFKLFVWLSALESGLQPGSLLPDGPVKVGDWQPRSVAASESGQSSLRAGLARSSNSLAVRLQEQLGRERVMEMAARLGITSPLRPEASLALGSQEVSLLEMTAAYGTVFNQGRAVRPHALLEITNRQGERLFQAAQAPGSGAPLLHPRTASYMQDMLGAVVAWGTGRAARLPVPAAGKTGTSQNNRDGWFIGHAGGITAGVWLGRDDGGPTYTASGGQAARLWHDFMTGALNLSPAAPSPQLSGPDLPAPVDDMLPPLPKHREEPDAPFAPKRGGFMPVGWRMNGE